MKIRKQQDSNECGLYVLQSLHQHYHKKWLSINELKMTSNIDQNGMNVASLIELGTKFGVSMDAFNAPCESLKSNEYFVVIIKNENLMHYVIVKWNRKEFEVWDSSKGHYFLKENELNEIYTGVVITTSEGTYSQQKKADITNIWSYLFQNVNLLVWSIVILTMSLILSFASTMFMKIVFDKIIPGGLTKLLNVIVVSFLFIAILRALMSFSKRYFNKKIFNIIEIDLTKKYMDKLKNGNINEVHKLDVSDHIRRIGMIPSIAMFISTGIQVIFDECITFVFSSSFLIWINPSLFGVALAVAILTSLATFIINLFIKEKHTELLTINKQEFLAKNEIIRSIDRLKETHRSKFLFKKWYKKYISFKKTNYTLWKYTITLGLVSSIINYVAPILITFLSVKLILHNEISAGSFIMFIGLFNIFITPLNSLSDFFIKLKQNLKQVELLQFVMDIPEYLNNEKGLLVKRIDKITLSHCKLTLSQPILDIDKITFTNKTILEGSNGTGKSMLLKVINGTYISDADLNINDIDVEFLNENKTFNKILTITDDEYLPSVTVLDYITMSNKSLLSNWIKNSAKFKLSAFLSGIGINLTDLIQDSGNNFSNGQKQIICLMRIFSCDFDVLILDEAFENISQENFIFLKTKINAITKFVIEVSHSKKYISNGRKVNIETINKCIY